MEEGREGVDVDVDVDVDEWEWEERRGFVAYFL